MRRRSLALFPLLIAAGFAAFQHFGAEKVTNPETGRSVGVAMSPDQEKAWGLQSYREVRSQREVATSGPELDLVLRVARRLAGAAGNGGGSFDSRVSLIRSPQANAFCWPGGRTISTGIRLEAEALRFRRSLTSRGSAPNFETAAGGRVARGRP